MPLVGQRRGPVAPSHPSAVTRTLTHGSDPPNDRPRGSRGSPGAARTAGAGCRASLADHGVPDALPVRGDVERCHPGLSIELVICRTSGDRVVDRPLADAGGKGLFTKELEESLQHGEIDFAVHSFKDVPVTMPLVDTAELIVAAVPRREDPRDVLVCHSAKSIRELPEGARVVLLCRTRGSITRFAVNILHPFRSFDSVLAFVKPSERRYSRRSVRLPCPPSRSREGGRRPPVSRSAGLLHL